MSDLNVLTIMGRLTADPVTAETTTGKRVTSFSIANNNEWGSGANKQKKVMFLKCTAWEKQGDVIAEYFKKGARILVTGRLESQEWEKDDKKHSTFNLQVKEFNFIDKYEKAKEEFREDSGASNVSPQLSDDDIPF